MNREPPFSHSVRVSLDLEGLDVPSSVGVGDESDISDQGIDGEVCLDTRMHGRR